MFATLDKSSAGYVDCADNSESEIKGKGRTQYYACENIGKRGNIKLS